MNFENDKTFNLEISKPDNLGLRLVITRICQENRLVWVVTHVNPESICTKLGVETGDIVVKFNNVLCNTESALTKYKSIETGCQIIFTVKKKAAFEYEGLLGQCLHEKCSDFCTARMELVTGATFGEESVCEAAVITHKPMKFQADSALFNQTLPNPKIIKKLAIASNDGSVTSPLPITSPLLNSTNQSYTVQVARPMKKYGQQHEGSSKTLKSKYMGGGAARYIRPNLTNHVIPPPQPSYINRGNHISRQHTKSLTNIHNLTLREPPSSPSSSSSSSNASLNHSSVPPNRPQIPPRIPPKPVPRSIKPPMPDVPQVRSSPSPRALSKHNRRSRSIDAHLDQLDSGNGFIV